MRSRDLRTYGFPIRPRVERPFRYFRLCRVWSTTLREHIRIDFSFTIVVINGRINGNLIVESWNLRYGKKKSNNKGISHKFRTIRHNELWIEYQLLESVFFSSPLSLSFFLFLILYSARRHRFVAKIKSSRFSSPYSLEVFMYLLRVHKKCDVEKKRKKRENARHR